MEFAFKEFTQHPFYTELNARLVELSRIRPGQVVVDLACGTGAVTRLVLERVRGAQGSLVIGVDNSAAALQQAREDLSRSYRNMTEFVQGRAEHVSESIRRSVDTVFLCNAIHMVPDKAEMLDEVRRVLRSGGVFAFNSAFFQGAVLGGTEGFYRRWMLKARRLVQRRHGLAPTRERVQARRPLSSEQYQELLESQGFQILDRRVETAHMPVEAWLDISSFSDFVQGTLPGVPLREASAALRDSVVEVFEELQLGSVPRGWLEVVAARS